MLVEDADLVVYGRVLEIDEVGAPKTAHSSQRPTLRLKVTRVIKGPGEPGHLVRAAQHGHGVSHYRLGDEALLFLRELSRSPELGGLGDQLSLRWYSNQEHDDAWVLEPASRKQALAAARRYAAMEAMPARKRLNALHLLTVELLTRGNARLAKSALRDLIALPDAPLARKDDVPQLLRVVHGTRQPIDIRVGLLAELQRRDLVEADAHWEKLLRVAQGPDRLAVIPAAGLHGGPTTRSALEEILFGPDVPTAVAAAVALGVPGEQSVIAPLTVALRSTDRRLAMAAVRALGKVGTSDAGRAIREAASAHPDATVRRRAKAELQRLDAR